MPLNYPNTLNGVIFDCDSTLSTIEGIDELAELAGVKSEVAELTNQAMNGDVALETVYSQRLELILPTQAQLQTIAQQYLANITLGAKETIAALKQAGIRVGIISGGLYAAILPLAVSLGVDESDVFAVSLVFNPDGEYVAVQDNLLTKADGKQAVVAQWKQIHQLEKVVLVGDGMSDVAALGAADMVIGYGGVIKREAVRQAASIYYEELDLRGLLGLFEKLAGYRI